MNSDEKISKVFYIIFLAAISAAVIFTAAIKLLGLKISDFLLGTIPECIFRETLGIYCPGCGGVRSFIFLTQGDLLNSMFYHPFVLYAVVFAAIFVVLYTLSIITKNKIRKPVIRPVYLYIGAGIIIVQWIVKVVFLTVFSIELIPF